MLGEVVVRKVEPGVTPTIDNSLDVVVRQVEPTTVPTLERSAPVVEQVTATRPTREDATPFIVFPLK